MHVASRFKTSIKYMQLRIILGKGVLHHYAYIVLGQHKVTRSPNAGVMELVSYMDEIGHWCATKLRQFIVSARDQIWRFYPLLLLN